MPARSAEEGGRSAANSYGSIPRPTTLDGFGDTGFGVTVAPDEDFRPRAPRGARSSLSAGVIGTGVLVFGLGAAVGALVSGVNPLASTIAQVRRPPYPPPARYPTRRPARRLRPAPRPPARSVPGPNRPLAREDPLDASFLFAARLAARLRLTQSTPFPRVPAKIQADLGLARAPALSSPSERHVFASTDGDAFDPSGVAEIPDAAFPASNDAEPEDLADDLPTDPEALRAKRVARRRAARAARRTTVSDVGDVMTPSTGLGSYDAEYSPEERGNGTNVNPMMQLFEQMLSSVKDTRELVHAPAATLSEKNADLLERLDREPDYSGEKEMGYLRYPHVRGDKVVFVSEGNIWVARVEGGPAARISASYSVEALPKLSPDGKKVAFLAQSVDGYEVFVVPVAGGAARRASYGSAAVKLEGWTDDGKILVVTSYFSPSGLPQLAKVDPETKSMSVLPFARATGGTQDEEGCYVFYPLRQTSSTKRYEGGEQSRLWRWCAGDDEAKMLTPESWTKRGSWSPVTSSRFPKKIFFLSDKSGVANLWVMNLDGTNKKRLTHECGMDIMEVSIDGEVGVARIGGELRRFKLEGDDGDVRLAEPLAPVRITLISEFRESSPQKLRFPLEELREVALSDDGMYAAIVIRGQIFFTPLLEQLGSRIEQVTGYDGAVRYRHVQFVHSEFPEDNVKLIAMSDASGEYEYVLLERRSGSDMGGLWNETQLTRGGSIKGVMSYSTVSPDSSSLVFDDTSGRISVLNLSTTAVNTFDFKTQEAKAPDDYAEGAGFAQMQMLQQMMGGYAPGAEDYEVGLSAAARAKGKPEGKPEDARDDTRPVLGVDPVKARQRSKLRRKRRELRREARSQFRRDWRLHHLLEQPPGSPISSTPRGFRSESAAKPRARDMHHNRYGAPPPTGGFTDLFGAHLGAAGPAPAGAPGVANMRTVMQGLRPEAAGDYSWSPDGKWLAFSAADETEFSTVNVWNVDTGEVQRLTHPSYNAVEPKFSPDGFFLYYFSDQQIESGADSPYGMRGSEPTIVGSQQLMCLPLREGFKCPFFLGDELNAQGQIFDPTVGKQIPTKVNTNNIEKRAVPVPFLEKRQYADLHIVNGGSTFVMQMWDGVGFYLIAVDIMSGSVVPIYPDPLGVFVSGDNSVLMIAVEQGLALFSAQALAMPGITQEELLGSAVVWTPPEGWTVTVNPRAEWMQMYNEAMRNMRDAFYDPNMHGVDWAAITEQYRPLVYRISTKSELRDVLQQALGELSVLHVFVSIRNEQPSLPDGEPTACLGGSLAHHDNGLEVVRVYDTSGILAAPDSPLGAMAVDIRPGDVITRVDGAQLNLTDAPLSMNLLGKAGMQVLLEVDQKPRLAQDDEEEQLLAQLQEAAGGPFGGAAGANEMGTVPFATMMGAMTTAYTAGPTRAAPSLGLPTVHRIADAKRRQLGTARAKSKKATKDEGGNGKDANAAAEADGKKGGKKKADEEKETKGGKKKETEEKKTPKMISGTKNVVVTPLSREECTQLKAADALNHRRNYVQRNSGDKLAYIYLEDMEQMGEGSSNSFDDFAAQFYPAIRKAGLIIDVRRNAGGNIDTWILERLRRVAWMFNTQRAGPGDTTMQYAFLGKVAVLVDEMTSSDAEIFAAGIQQLGLGKVIGMRSWGGAVGYSSNPELALVDGSGFTIPSFGPYVGGKWMIEQQGVVPDIVVENPPVATFNGHDKQLDAAIDHLMKLIEDEPKAEKIPAKPAYPDWSFDRKVCAEGGDGGAEAGEKRASVLAA